jgi:hypothetical protein
VVLDVARHVPAALAIAVLGWVSLRARSLDEHSRSDLRSLLWPQFEAERVKANVGHSLLAAVLGLSLAVPWMALPPATLLVLECLTAILAAYVLIGSALTLSELSTIVRGTCPENDPAAVALIYVLSWPFWHAIVPPMRLRC